MKLRASVSFLCCLLACGLAVAALCFWLYRPVVSDQDLVIVVRPGESFASVARDLARRGVQGSPKWLRLYARLTGADTMLRPGKYSFPVDTSLSGLLSILTKGKPIPWAATLVEGRTLGENLKAWNDSYLALTGPGKREEALQTFLKVQASSPEGLFFADTYFYEFGDTDIGVLRRAHRRLLKVLEEEWTGRQPGLPYKNPYEALVMASLVERETAVSEERPRIAGVFVRRLRKKMRLQSDPTVIYGMGAQYTGQLTRTDLRQRTAYNTYRIRGLPPTPIALVGRTAIHAALHPDQGTALYFVARGDGTHEFSDSLPEHRKAVATYQLNRRSDYRSTPLKADATPTQRLRQRLRLTRMQIWMQT